MASFWDLFRRGRESSIVNEDIITELGDQKIREDSSDTILRETEIMVK